MQSLEDRYRSFHELLQQEDSLEETLRMLCKTLKTILSVEQASVLLYDKEEKQLWTVLMDQKEKILVPYDQGIVGETFRTAKVQLENEPYDNPNFFAEVDMQLGFYTQSILAAPLFDEQDNVIGVIELLNKPGGFDKADHECITYFANVISDLLENNNIN